MDSRRRSILAAGLGLVMNNSTANENPLPRIGVGTWQAFDVGGDEASRSPLREVIRLLDRNVVDSSPMYGRAEGIREMETSFRRLRVERMDLMQVHNLLDVEVHTKTLQDWKQAGKIRFMGITHYTASAHAEVEKLLKTKRYDFVQINYSLGEREAERSLLGTAKNLGVRVIINRPFAEGRLFGRVKGKPLPPWAAELGIASWAQYFLKWIVSHPAVTCAIPGTGRPDHMKDNLAGGAGPMPDHAQRKNMADYFDSL